MLMKADHSHERVKREIRYALLRGPNDLVRALGQRESGKSAHDERAACQQTRYFIAQ